MMFPDPAWQAQQRQHEQRRFREMNEASARRSRSRSRTGLGGLLKFLLLVAVVVLLVKNPELRTEAWTFVQHFWTDVQNA
jgi:hypothetical protein